MMRRFFFRRLKNYYALLMIPSLLLLIGLLVANGNSQLRAMEHSSAEALDNIKEGFNSLYEDICYQQDMMTLNPQLTLSLKKILLHGRTSYTDYVFLNSMKSILMTAARSHPAVHSIYLYIDGYDNFLSSIDGSRPLSGYHDAGFLDLYAALPMQSDSAIVRRVIPASSYALPQDVITIFQRMTYIPGVVVVNVSEKAFARSMEAFLPSDYRLTTLGPDGQPILTLGGEIPASLQELVGQSSNLQRFGGHYYLIQTSLDARLGVHFALLLPASVVGKRLLASLAAPLLMLLLVAVLMFVLAWRTTRRNFRQIDEIIQMFKDAEAGTLSARLIHPSRISDEYDLIINNVIRSFMNTTFLDQQLSQQKYEKQAAELTALQLQINPHFLMNTLQTLGFEVCKLTNSFTSPLNKIIANLSDILRYSLASVDEPVTVNDELVNVRKYVEIQSFRFPDAFTVEYRVDEQALSLPFKRLILQPLVENSISHGIRPTLRPGKIRVRIAVRDESLCVKCVDNGAGMSRDKLEALRANLNQGDNGRRIGLNNVNRRLILNYGEGSALRILSREGLGTCISFRIPLKSHMDEAQT